MMKHNIKHVKAHVHIKYVFIVECKILNCIIYEAHSVNNCNLIFHRNIFIRIFNS